MINSSLVGVVEAAAQSGRVGRVLGLRHGVEGLLAQDFVDLTAASNGLLEGLANTPSSALGSCRYKLKDEELGGVAEILRRQGVGYFVYIGGNDSADSCQRIGRAARAAGLDLVNVAVPKTVDNDLPDTDHCPGYGSAARFLASMLMDVSRDTEAMRRTDPVKIVEVSGRHAGWLAAAASLGRRDESEGPHLVYVPERPFGADVILEQVDSVVSRHGHAVLVLSENQPGTDGKVLGSDGEPVHVDAFGHAYYDSPAMYLARAIRGELGVRARWERPGTIQRMSTAHRSPVDAAEARTLGQEAVIRLLRGDTDVMVTLKRTSDAPYATTMSTTRLEVVANQQRLLDDAMVAHPTEYPNAAFKAYAEPLLGGPLPEHARL